MAQYRHLLIQMYYKSIAVPAMNYELFFNLPFQSMHFYMLSTKLDNIIQTYVHTKQIWKQQTLKKHSLTKARIAKLIRNKQTKSTKIFYF